MGGEVIHENEGILKDPGSNIVQEDMVIDDAQNDWYTVCLFLSTLAQKSNIFIYF